MSNQEDELEKMFLFKDGESFETCKENLVDDLITTLEDETKYSDCGTVYFPNGVKYTIKMDYGALC